ncbi:MAG TPA: rhamnulokinase family protein [Pirellulales bacterium]|jgi:rhamnulokinase
MSAAIQKIYTAIDLGASSGRHIAGLFDGARLDLAETYRFGNAAVPMAGHLYWDLPHLWQQIGLGLRKTAEAYPGQIATIGVDTWGVDFGLLGRGDELLGNPYHYRDTRTNGMLDAALARVPREQIFAATGIQFMQINTLYQLLAMRLANSPLLAEAKTFLLMADLFNWLLTGEKLNERTNATTTQAFDPRTADWAWDLLSQLEIPTEMFCPIVQPGTKLGRLRGPLAAEWGLAETEVVVPGTHDTASAVVSVPAAQTSGDRPNWCYISSGTWSLMGVEISHPVLNDRCRELNFTNEGGVGGTTRLLKNIAGLWLVQECRRVWNSRGANRSWQDLNRLSATAVPLAALIDPDDPSFLAPPDMPEAIRAYCRRTGQTVPADEGSVLRAATDSLALRYRQVLSWLEELIGGPIETIHVVGGGSNNRQLCQATADACRRRVVAGPVEATAIGNLLMQAVAVGDIGSIADARSIVRHSFGVDEFLPRDGDRWDEAYARFRALTKA